MPISFMGNIQLLADESLTFFFPSLANTHTHLALSTLSCLNNHGGLKTPNCFHKSSPRLFPLPQDLSCTHTHTHTDV